MYSKTVTDRHKEVARLSFLSFLKLYKNSKKLQHSRTNGSLVISWKLFEWFPERFGEYVNLWGGGGESQKHLVGPLPPC
jgi:hypothetical protein